MIISKSPFRISFFGGGTDYPKWYKKNGGAVISGSINKYSYITCRELPPFFNYKYRIRYYKREEKNDIEDIEHPSVKNAIKYLNIKCPLDIVHHADLPAMSGLGSSSTFTVGMLHALYALKNKMPTKEQLASDAIYIEQKINKENVGSQDQTIAAYGGINKISFGKDYDFNVEKILMSQKKINQINESCMLFFTGFQRNASKIALKQIKLIEKRKPELNDMLRLVDDAYNILKYNSININDFGKLLDEQWKIKRTMTNKISNDEIDSMYSIAKKNGAIGAKLLGAGGGGFLLVIAKKNHQAKLKKALSNILYVPFKFETSGSSIIYHDNHL